MPITPAEAEKGRRRKGDGEFKKACERIDEYLTETRLPAYWDHRDCSADTIERIVKAYSALGWDVKHIYDQRDGNCLKFDKR